MRLFKSLPVFLLCFLIGCASTGSVKNAQSVTTISEEFKRFPQNVVNEIINRKYEIKFLIYNLATSQAKRENGLNLHYSDAKYRTILIMAVINNDIKTVKFCLENRADVNAASESGATALIEAAGAGNLEITTLLVNHGALVNMADNSGFTPLIYAAISGNVKVVQFLLDKGADIKATTKNGYSALIFACACGKNEVSRLLIKKGSDSSTINMMMAASAGLDDFVERFIKDGQDVNQRTSSDDTPLIFAAKNGNLSTVKLLMKNKADASVRNKDGFNAFLAACSTGKSRVAEYFINSGGNETDYIAGMLMAAAYNMPDVIKLLAKKKVDINCKDNKGRTPLMIACLEGHLDAVKALVENGASLAERDMSLNGQTVLMTAAYNQHAGVVKYLISKGADVNDVKNDGWTVLLIACEGGSLDVVKLLVEKGADKEAKLRSGATPITIALMNNNFDIYKYLVGKGADTSVTFQGYSMTVIAQELYNQGKISIDFLNYIKTGK